MLQKEPVLALGKSDLQIKKKKKDKGLSQIPNSGVVTTATGPKFLLEVQPSYTKVCL